MRTDKDLDSAVRDQESWQAQTHLGQMEDPINQSFSGEEQNRWYYNRSDDKGRDLQELSILSGLDSISDGRGFAIGDFNHDGRPDIALCNANAPLLQIFENQIGTDNHFVILRFEGSATQKTSQQPASNRDGYGASVKLTLDNGQTIMREFRCGEGFASQNSDTMIVGIGDAKSVQQIETSWPAGEKNLTGPVPAGNLVTLKESSEDTEPEIAPYSRDN